MRLIKHGQRQWIEQYGGRLDKRHAVACMSDCWADWSPPPIITINTSIGVEFSRAKRNVVGFEVATLAI